MLQCLNNVPRPLSHQRQKLQSSSHCFHCCSTCSPIHTHTHAHTVILPVTTPTSASLNPLLLSLSPLFLSRSLKGTPSPPFTSPFPLLSLCLPSHPTLQHSLLGRLICDAAHKVLYAAICAPMHKGNPKASARSTARPSIKQNWSWGIPGSSDMLLSFQGCTKKTKG